MISGYVIGDKEISRRLQAVPDNVRSSLTDTIGRIALRLQRHVMRDKLSGQALKVRTGTLRRSIDQRLVTDGQTISGVVSTNVEYAKVHEYGFKGTVTVKEHLRLVKQAFGKQLKSPVWATVKTHTAKIDLPARSFLRSALADMQHEVVSEIDHAVSNGVKT